MCTCRCVRYERLEKTIRDSRSYIILPFTPPADALVSSWRMLKLRIGLKDLRIASTAIVHGAKLVTRNERDYKLMPGLNLEVWK